MGHALKINLAASTLLCTLACSAGQDVGEDRDDDAADLTLGRRYPSVREQRTLLVDGVERRYSLQRPVDSAQGPFAVLFVFHGTGGDGERALSDTPRLVEAAERYGIILVGPSGLGGRWNNDPDLPGSDLPFIGRLIEHVLERERGDRSRVYATGISAGAGMSYAMACVHGDIFSAIAPVAAGIGADLLPRCRPARPVAVVAFHGTADWMVPYEGGHVFGDPKMPVAVSAEESLRFFAQHDACAASPYEVPLPDRDLLDGTTAKVLRYPRCAGGLKVALFTLEGGGHTWPGAAADPQWTWLFGRTNRDVDASLELLRVFRRTRAHAESPPW